MDKITAVLLDDETKNNELLKIYLKRYCPSIRVVALAKTVKKAIKKIDELKPKIIFLDIVLADGTGFDVLEQIQHENFHVIFVTAFQEYAVTAFKFNALDFLLKPIDPIELTAAVKKIHTNIENKIFTNIKQIESVKSANKTKTSNYNFIAIPSTRKIYFKRLDDILYFESDGRYTVVHLFGGESIVVAKNIGEYEKLLAPNYFFRIHQKYLINIKYIININNKDGSSCEIEGNLVLPLAKRRKEELVSFLNIR